MGTGTPEWIAGAVGRALPSRGALFVSDIHLGAAWGDPGRETSLCERLLACGDEVQDLILGGDVFEFWFEWKHVRPHLGAKLLSCLEALAKTRRVWMIRGNHDFALGTVIASHGIGVLEDGLCLEIDGRRWLFLHGDGMAPSDRIDRLVRRILRHPLSNWAWRTLLHPDLAMRLALGTGKVSRAAQPGPAPNLLEYQAEAFRWMHAWDLAGVVHGHTHRPHLVEKEGRCYVNNGDWSLMRTCISVGPGGARLENSHES